MMDVKEIMESGLLEEYCLGTLTESQAREITKIASTSEELKTAIDLTLESLQKVDPAYTIPIDLKAKVLHLLSDKMQSKPINLLSPPLIDKYSDHRSWSAAVKDKKYESERKAFEILPLFANEKLELHLVWLHTELVEEAHQNEFKESFLILEGECECDFGGLLVRFKQGDYFEIPTNTRHSIRNITIGAPYVKGIVQRLAS